MNEVKRHSLIKPTIQTPFHIDFEWWKQQDTNWKVHLYSCLCDEHRKSLANIDENASIDWVDPVTGEVQTTDGMQFILITHCAKEEGFITNQTTMIDAIFRLFLSNGNTPLSAANIAESISRQPDIILQTLTGAKVHKGIRPVMD